MPKLIVARNGAVRASQGAPAVASPRSGWYLPEEGPAINAAVDRSFIYYAPLRVEEACTVSAISVYVNSGSASVVGSVGLMENDNGIPGDQIDEYITGASLASTGVVQATGLTIQLKRGLYWRAYVSSGGAAHPQLRTVGGFSRWVCPSSNSDQGAAGYREAGTAIPSSANPATSVFQVPRISMLVA